MLKLKSKKQSQARQCIPIKRKTKPLIDRIKGGPIKNVTVKVNQEKKFSE